MGRQALKQQARRAAMVVQAERRKAAGERDRRLSEKASRVVVAMFERAEVLARSEREAGEALHEMTTEEGLSLREAVELCGGQISEREAGRLRQLYRRAPAQQPAREPAQQRSDDERGQAEDLAAGQDPGQYAGSVGGQRDASTVVTAPA